eukprot:11063200-Alexandrium_andersonii.AAC.1
MERPASGSRVISSGDRGQCTTSPGRARGRPFGRMWTPTLPGASPPGGPPAEGCACAAGAP